MKFLRTHTQRHSKLGKNRKKIQRWRRPNGRDNKIREGKRGHPKAVSIGFKKPRTEKPVLIHNLAELNMLNKNQAAQLAKIGAKKRLELIKKAHELKITLLNLREPKEKKK